MRKNYFSLFILFLFLTSFVFTSCDDDDEYDLGRFTISLATVNPIDEQNGTYYLTLDNGTTLWPAASNAYYKPKNDQRVIVSFTLLSDSLSGYDHFVKINALQEILTKSIIDLTTENEEEIGYDPVKILDLWVGDNYLNIHYGINVGGEQIHTLNLVQNKTNRNSNENEIILELRHNSNGDPQRYGSNGYAAFDLREFKSEGQSSVKFIVKNLDFNDEEKVHNIIYKYNDIANSENIQKNIESTPDNTFVK